MIALPVSCVVDASVGIKLVIAEADSSLAHALFAHLAHDAASRFYVPDFFFLECANVLWKLLRKRLLTSVQAKANQAALQALALTLLPVTGLTDDALDIAARYDVSVYDAAYVAALAQPRVPLVTADDKLVKKFASTSYSVVLLSLLTIPAPPTATP